ARGHARAGGARVARPETERGRDPGGAQRPAARGARCGRRPGAERRRGRASRYSQLVKLQAVELQRIKLSLVAPFETSFGVQTERDVLLLKAITDAGVG